MAPKIPKKADHKSHTGRAVIGETDAELVLDFDPAEELAALESEDEALEFATGKPNSQRDDIQRLDLNKIYNMDCIEGMKMMPDNCVDLVVTSPPYNVGKDYDVCDDSRPWEWYYDWCPEWMQQVYRILQSDGRFCLNHLMSTGSSGYRHSPITRLSGIAEDIGFRHHGLALWTDGTLAKRTAWGSWLSASAPYINNPFEGILILFKHQWKKERKGTTQIEKDKFMQLATGIWNIRPETNGLTKCNFPVELATNCIQLLSYEGDLVLDPFMGSGTTAIAAMRNNRNFIGFELSKSYCEIARNRIESEKSDL